MPKIEIRRWDILDHLKTNRDMAGYLEAAFEDDDPQMIAVALGDIARAKGMTKIAEQTGLGRESLYKALSSEGNPQFATVLKVVDALGFRICVKTKVDPTRRSGNAATKRRDGDGNGLIDGSSPVPAVGSRRRPPKSQVTGKAQ